MGVCESKPIQKRGGKPKKKCKSLLLTNSLAMLVLTLLLAFVVPLSVLASNSVDPLIYLHKYGYLGTGRSSAKSLKNAVMDFQKMANLPVTGVIDQATKTKMKQPRCGFPDSPQTSLAQNAYGYRKWTKTHLTYRYYSLTNDLRTSEVRSIIALAFKAFSDVIPMTFSETKGRWPDLKIGFYHGGHGDNDYFDGKGGVLAHAFFPKDGRIHFDEGEQWTNGRSNYGRTSLFYTAAHEIGHALGLPHIQNRKALMYPLHIDFGNRFSFRLPYADKYNIQRIYGAGGGKGGFITPVSKICIDNNKSCHLWKYLCYKNDYVKNNCDKTCGRCT